MTLLIGFFLLSITFSFLCSIWEAVLLSITPSYVKRKEQEDPSTGKLIASLKKDIDKPLSAILTLNTVAHTVGAIGVGAQAGHLFGTQNINMFGFHLSYESLVATIMTLAILFISEIFPKTIGANNWKSLAPITARSLKVLLWVLTPFVWVSGLLTKMLKKDKNKSIFSKQDFMAMTDVVSESGAIAKDDSTLIKNVLKFDELLAKDVMTPRTVMITANENQNLRDFYKKNKPFRFSRIPLYDENQDIITGVLLKDDVLEGLIQQQDKDSLKSVKRKISFVSKEESLRTVFKQLNDKREHIAIVVDEYGGVAGLVTLEDIIETLLGLEIMDETDTVSDLQSFARQKWGKRAKKMGLINSSQKEE